MSISLIATIALMVLSLLIGVFGWARKHRMRYLVWGVGQMLIPLGLWLLGVMDLAVNGVMSIVAWVQRTNWSDIMTWGASLAGVGLLLTIVSQFMPKEAKPVSPPAERAPVAASPNRPSSYPATKAAPPAKGKSAPMSQEDQEVEDLLRKRGIM